MGRRRNVVGVLQNALASLIHINKFAHLIGKTIDPADWLGKPPGTPLGRLDFGIRGPKPFWLPSFRETVAMASFAQSASHTLEKLTFIAF